MRWRRCRWRGWGGSRGREGAVSGEGGLVSRRGVEDPEAIAAAEFAESYADVDAGMVGVREGGGGRWWCGREEAGGEGGDG